MKQNWSMKNQWNCRVYGAYTHISCVYIVCINKITLQILALKQRESRKETKGSWDPIPKIRLSRGELQDTLAPSLSLTMISLGPTWPPTLSRPWNGGHLTVAHLLKLGRSTILCRGISGAFLKYSYPQFSSSISGIFPSTYQLLGYMTNLWGRTHPGADTLPLPCRLQRSDLDPQTCWKPNHCHAKICWRKTRIKAWFSTW